MLISTRLHTALRSGSLSTGRDTHLLENLHRQLWSNGTARDELIQRVRERDADSREERGQGLLSNPAASYSRVYSRGSAVELVVR